MRIKKSTLTANEIQKIMFKLRCTAEKDPDDKIANMASQLAFELELPRRINELSDTDRNLILYSNRKNYEPTRSL
jgi:hypothetical protein|tara:strand:+ start:693 stop:917 length:225 start_codon:yes stop_codon:yes gene_type:complete